VSNGGQAKQSAPGTETANEGKGTGVPWAKRKAAPTADASTPKGRKY
jgi:hypothetical protein